ncbi:hypothetical protein H5125_21125 [Shewanella sp. SR44-4]|jgi:hypothetical protein|uniref:hypothetical protein n=1 Tax=Shewanella sp. SR44-4 TaxID=2760935 RepID=UPI001600E0E1|nr:hypothetical protein [Shewanella sp. SR44-4]MBB1364649.1 hypothetical protein [Shewanella sp. SR44-4]
MTVIRELNVNLNDWETRYILESLSKEMAHLKAINASSEDEDEAADAGNDFIEVSGLYDQMSSNAVEVFGQQILDFSRDEI